MQTELDLQKRILGSINKIESEPFLTSSDLTRYATIIEAYLFALGYFNEQTGTLYDCALKKQRKFIWWKWEEVEPYAESMVRHGKLYLKSINYEE